MKDLSVVIYSFGITSMFAVLGLVGCQTVGNDLAVPIIAKSPKPDIYEEAIITFPQNDDNEYIRSWRLPELPVESLNRYDWQLVQWVDKQGVIAQVDTEQPLVLDIRPSHLVFNYGCMSYSVQHSDYNDYSYSPYSVTTITPPTCLKKDSQVSSDILQYLTDLFPRYGRGRFSFELLSSPLEQPATKPLSLISKLNLKKTPAYHLSLDAQGNKFIFKGVIKTIKPAAGLTITNALLETYRWRLVSAMDSNQQPIAELNYRSIPIHAGFYTNNYQSGASFGSGCNGVGGPYTLTPDHILSIGSGAQTMMGCGPKREAAEDKIKQLEQISKSQLTLMTYPDTNVDDPSLPYYLLTQKLETGETLIWKNEKEVTR